MPYTTQLVERGASHSFVAEAKPPTVTMPRIKVSDEIRKAVICAVRDGSIWGSVMVPVLEHECKKNSLNNILLLFLYFKIILRAMCKIITQLQS